MICSNRLRRTARLGIGPRRQPASRRPRESSVFYPSAGGVRIRCLYRARRSRPLQPVRRERCGGGPGTGFRTRFCPRHARSSLSSCGSGIVHVQTSCPPGANVGRSSHTTTRCCRSAGGPTAMVVLQSDATKRACGGSIRARNARVATRAGSVEIAASQLGESNDPALIVPDGVIITRSLFSFAPLSRTCVARILIRGSGARRACARASALCRRSAPAVRLPISMQRRSRFSMSERLEHVVSRSGGSSSPPGSQLTAGSRAA